MAPALWPSHLRAAPAVQDHHTEWRHLPGCRSPGHCLLIKNHPGKEKRDVLILKTQVGRRLSLALFSGH